MSGTRWRTPASAYAPAILAGLLIMGPATTASAATVVIGSVDDATTGARVIGAAVVIRRGNDVLGQAATDADGHFRLVVDVPARPEAQTLTLLVEREGYAVASDDVVVVSGRAAKAAYPVSLLPRPVADCRRHRPHTIIVGYFRPPTTAPRDLELAPRIADTLTADLLTRIQQFRLRADSQPIVLTCAAAKPQTTSDNLGLARALLGDAFLSGYVVPSGVRYKVEMIIADRFGLLVPPARASSADVDLDDPQAGRLHVAAHTAILTALVRGYEESNENAECVEVTSAAERILGTMPGSIAAARGRCQAKLGNARLLLGAPP